MVVKDRKDLCFSTRVEASSEMASTESSEVAREGPDEMLMFENTHASPEVAVVYNAAHQKKDPK